MTPDPALVIDAPTEPTLPAVQAGTRTQVVLDTSALVADPEGVLAGYPDCDLIVPLTVIEELDGLKKRLDPVGMSARDVLRRIALGHTNAEIAGQLYLSVRTVETHRAHIQQKLGKSSRAELVRYALDNDLIDR